MALMRTRFRTSSCRPVAALYRYIDFRDTLALGGVIIDNDDRDRHEFTGTARLAYRISPRLQVYGAGALTYVNYANPFDNAGINRDNQGFGITGGVIIELANKLFGEIFAGYQRRNYDDFLLSNITGPTGGLRLTWNPTGLTTVKGLIVNTIEQSTLLGASGFYATQGRVSVDHELRRNIIISGFASFQLDDYQGISREDKWIRAGLRMKYLLNRYLNGILGYEYTHRKSNVSNQTFTRHLVILSIKGQL